MHSAHERSLPGSPIVWPLKLSRTGALTVTPQTPAQCGQDSGLSTMRLGLRFGGSVMRSNPLPRVCVHGLWRDVDNSTVCRMSSLVMFCAWRCGVVACLRAGHPCDSSQAAGLWGGGVGLCLNQWWLERLRSFRQGHSMHGVKRGARGEFAAWRKAVGNLSEQG